jgi:hypothetical protein
LFNFFLAMLLLENIHSRHGGRKRGGRRKRLGCCDNDRFGLTEQVLALGSPVVSRCSCCDVQVIKSSNLETPRE